MKLESTLRLFNAIPVAKQYEGHFGENLLRHTLRYGFVYDDFTLGSYTENELAAMTPTVVETVGLSPEQMNSSFHKSWDKVQNSPMWRLAVQQMAHYITTYGFERLGIYNSAFVYIPKEALEIPEINIDRIRLTVIHGLTFKELKDRTLAMLSTGVALSDQTLEDVTDILHNTGLSGEELCEIRNKEAAIRIGQKLGVVPNDPVELLRAMIYVTTGNTLIIKNPGTIQRIKEGNLAAACDLYENYIKAYGPAKVAEVFYRFKPLFLAFRSFGKMRGRINELRRLACTYHKPMKPDFLNSITAILRKDKGCIASEYLSKALSQKPMARKIRLFQTLDFHAKRGESIMYQIRNGKSFATENRPIENVKGLKAAKDEVRASIISDLSKHVAGKKIFLPDEITYRLPATEKQFVGNIPMGSFLHIPENLVFGVHWYDVKGERIDLDLSMINISGNKYGWDGAYRYGQGSRAILFSGDMTAAPKPHGASEMFFVSGEQRGAWLVKLNYFNGHFGTTANVPFTFFIGTETYNKLPWKSAGEMHKRKAHMIDPNNVLFRMKGIVTPEEREMTIGMVSVEKEGIFFYFVSFGQGNQITATRGKKNEHTLNFMQDKFSCGLNLNSALAEAGAVFVVSPEEAEIDFSIENLKKDTFLSLLA